MRARPDEVYAYRRAPAMRAESCNCNFQVNVHKPGPLGLEACEYTAAVVQAEAVHLYTLLQTAYGALYLVHFRLGKVGYLFLQHLLKVSDRKGLLNALHAAVPVFEYFFYGDLLYRYLAPFNSYAVLEDGLYAV